MSYCVDYLQHTRDHRFLESYCLQKKGLVKLVHMTSSFREVKEGSEINIF